MTTDQAEYIEIMFTCRQCGVNKRKVRCRLRHANEDVVAWLDYAAERAGAMHTLLAPLCPSRHVDLMVPLKKDTTMGVGHEAP